MMPAAPDTEWYRALTTSERIESLRTLHSDLQRTETSIKECARRRLERWSSWFPHTRQGYPDQLAVKHGISNQHLLHILGEPIECVRARSYAIPGWMRTLNQTLSGMEHCKPDRYAALVDQTTAPFVWLLVPFIVRAQSRLRKGMAELRRSEFRGFAPETMIASLSENLCRRLLEIV